MVNSLRVRLGLLFLAFLLLVLAAVAVTYSVVASQRNDALLINLAGRQRMLSQRMAKLHQALNWNLPAGTMREDLAAARKEFAAAMAELEAAPINTDKLKSDLKLASQQWFFFQNALDEKRQDTLTRATNVATTSERILEIMEAVVTGYEALH